MDDGVALRSYQSEDEVATVDLWRECRLLRPSNDPAEDIQLCLAAPSSELMLAMRGQQVVGSAMLGHDRYRGWVYYLAVRPNSQRRGIGRLLMTFAETWMKERNVPKLQAMIRPDNLLAHGFYRNLGYLSDNIQLVEKYLNSRSKTDA